MKTLTETDTYDVVIMGGGFAGLCQARHLMLNIPNIKVALIDPRPEDRSPTDLKVGESTVEIGAMFLAKDLGLFNYLVDNQLPKYGLNFHWPKDSSETEDIDDYFHIWTNWQPAIPSFQVNRPKLERDLIQMNNEMGITYIQGRVVDFDLTSGEELKTIEVKLKEGKVTFEAKHLIDASGRRQLIGRKQDNLILDTEDLYGVNNGAAWMRVKNIDRDLFHHDFHPERSIVSFYYGTNHYFGNGHWLWMIPIDSEEKEVSIGVIHHHERVPARNVNTQEKFLNFLEHNHGILHNLIQNSEVVDYNYLPKLAHKSKKMLSEDNWYVVGDAACIFDAFYSLGTSIITFGVTSVTEVIRAKLAGEADAEQKRAAYNEYNLTFADSCNAFVHNHANQLGHASVMSWRIYFEYMFWFGILVPIYVGKWHLDVDFLKLFIGQYRSFLDGLVPELYEEFNQLVDRNANIGLMDCYRADQLIWGYNTPKHFDDFLENTKLEPQRSNIFGSMKHTFFYAAIWYAKFQWKGFGLKGVLNPRHIYQFCKLLGVSGLSAMGELQHRFQRGDLPDNTEVAEMREEFKNYRYQPLTQPRV